MSTELVDRIMGKVRVTDAGCWEFTGCKVRGGYGQIRIAGKGQYTHRVMHELHSGPIPEGYDIDHLCRNRACCNPSHLEAVTRAVNAARTPPGARGQNRATVEKAKTHCPQGHPYDDENTRTNAAGHRWCRACQRARYQSKKAS